MLKHTIGFILLTLTILATSSKAETTCVTNSLGDRTCTTVTSGTTTGNILQNSTFGTGNTTTTTGWQVGTESPRMDHLRYYTIQKVDHGLMDTGTVNTQTIGKKKQ